MNTFYLRKLIIHIVLEIYRWIMFPSCCLFLPDPMCYNRSTVRNREIGRGQDVYIRRFLVDCYSILNARKCGLQVLFDHRNWNQHPELRQCFTRSVSIFRVWSHWHGYGRMEKSTTSKKNHLISLLLLPKLVSLCNTLKNWQIYIEKLLSNHLINFSF